MDAPRTILNLFFRQLFAKYRDCFNSPFNQPTPLATHNFLTIEIGRMERNGCGSMGMQVNFAGVEAENRITVTKEAGDSTANAADVSRRRKPVVKKYKGFYKKKRMSRSSDAFVPPPLPPNIVDQGSLALLFSKMLHKSDVNNIGRIVLPKKATEAYLPVLLDNDSIILPMIDMDTGNEWSFKFRYWPNNKSRMYVLEGTGTFTKKHRLEAGDHMLVYQDLVNQTYVIRAVRAYGDEEECSNEEVANLGENKNKELQKDADSMNQTVAGEVEFEAFNLLDHPTNFPNMENMSLMNDNSYFSDILNSFSSWDEFMINNYPPIQQITSFENLSSEDLSQV